ncbi:MAG: hypothetical protein ACI4OE_00165 [Alphaproteobacteria bacterium]
MSICVAVGNKVMDTRLPQPAGCSDKYDVSGRCRKRFLSTFCKFFKYPSPDAKASPSPAGGERLHRPWCHKILGTDCASRPRMTGGRRAGFVRLLHRCIPHNDVCSVGRSMIEMLGVLAIIGVLTVGGIAGYSKAMEKYKMNKIISEYSFMISGLLEHLNNLKQNSSDVSGTKIGLTDFAEAANIIPSTWKKASTTSLTDSYGNGIVMYLGATQNDGKLLVLDFWLGGKDKSFDVKFCREFFYNVAYPLHPVVIHASMHRDEQGTTRANIWRGDAYCDGSRKCLRDITLSDINSACHTCVNGKESCAVILWF